MTDETIKQMALNPIALKAGYVAASSLLGFSVGDVISGNGWLGLIGGAVMALILALINRRPAMLQQKRDADRIHSTEAAGVIENLNNVHAAETDSLNRRLDELRQDARVATADMKKMRYARELVRVGKHKLQSELQRSYLWINEAQNLLTINSVKHTPFEYKTADQIFNDEDKKMVELFKEDGDL